MSTILSFTFDDLDAEIKAQYPEYTNRSDFATLRTRAFKRALSEYEDGLHSGDDRFARADNLASPIVIGTEKINTTIGDLYTVALPTDALRVAGDSIFVSSSTTTFDVVPRVTIESILPSGTGATNYGFYENNGKLVIYDKEGNFGATATAAFNYYRNLDATQTPTTTPLDIKHRDFGQIVDATIAFLKSYI